MNRCVAALAVVSILGIGAGAAGAKTVNDFDQKLDSATARVSELEKAVRDVSPPTAKRGGNSSPDRNVLYGACRAVALGNEAACFVSAQGDAKQQSGCKGFFWNLIQSKVLITAANEPARALRTCLDMRIHQNKLQTKKVDPAIFCRDYVRYAGDARERAASLWSLLRDSPTQAMDASVVDEELAAMGSADLRTCQSQDDWASRLICTTARSYRAAYARKDAKLCGDSALCRALMEQGEGVCYVYAPSTADPKQLFMELTSTANDLMALLNSLDMGTSRGAGYAAKRQRILALHKRCEVLISKLRGPGSAKAGESGAPARAAP
jgi:hypothetical protein